MPACQEGLKYFFVGIEVTDKKNKRVTPIPVNNLDELLREVERHKDSNQSYMALASFKIGEKGYNRRQINAVKVKSLWIDVDCFNPNKPDRKAAYASVEAGLEALAAYLAESGLPQPTIINSGFGLHVYWPLTYEIEPERWKGLALKLKASVTNQGLQADHSRTTDCASILRVPGTVNWGFVESQFVTLLQLGEPTDPAELERLLSSSPAPAEIFSSQPGSPPPPLPPEGDGNPLAEREDEWLKNNSLADKRDRDPLMVIKYCQQVREAGDHDVDRLTWFLMLAVMTFCANGREWARAISQKDLKRFNEEVFHQQFDSAKGGPPLCETFEFHDRQRCEGCLHKGKIKTPVQLGDIVEVKGQPHNLSSPTPSVESVTPAALAGPDKLGRGEAYKDRNFEVIPGEGLYSITYEKQGDKSVAIKTLINRNEFYFHDIEMEVDRDTKSERRFIKFDVKHKDHKRLRTVVFETNEISSSNKFNTWLQNHGLMPVERKFYNRMFDFMTAFGERIQAHQTTLKMDHFGWEIIKDNKTGENYLGFIWANKAFTERGERKVSLTNDRCQRMVDEELKSCGSLEEWRKIPEMYSRFDQKEAQLFICAGFATPWMKFMPGSGKNLVMSIWEPEGGRGKTTLLEVVSSIWGESVEQIVTKTTTLASRYQIIGVRRNLPFCVDELTTMREEDLQNFLFDISQGKEKRKTKSGGVGFMNTGQWQTITMVTSNRSIREILNRISGQTKAESMRVVEIECAFKILSREENDYFDRCLMLKSSNYGLAGPEFMRNCLAQPDFKEKFIEDVMTFVYETRTKQSERFWCYGLGAAIVAGREAVRQGLISYDMDALERWVKEVLLVEQREETSIKPHTSLNILSSFFYDHLPNVLAVRMKKRPIEWYESADGDLRSDPYVVRAPTSKELKIRLELDTYCIYVDKKFLEEWGAERRISVKTLIRELIEEGCCDPWNQTTYSLGMDVSGLNFGKTPCYVFLGTKLGLDLLVDIKECISVVK
jgi:hypothetical protein